MKQLLAVLILLCSLSSVATAQDIFPTDTLFVNTTDCNSPTVVCLPIGLEQAMNYEFTLDGAPYDQMMPGCDFDTIIQYNFNTLFGAGFQGPYQLNGWNVSGMTFTGQFDNLFGLVALMNMWNPAGNWTFDQANARISGGSGNDTYGSMDITAVQNGQPSIIGVNFGLNAQGIQLIVEEGTHTVGATDGSESDSLIVVITCFADPTIDIITDEIVFDMTSNFKVCLGDEELTGPAVSIENICPEESGSFVSFSIDTAEFCVKYTALACGGTETACFVLCDAQGVCDTTYLEITVNSDICEPTPETVIDTVLINFTETICLDTTELPGTVIGLENACPDPDGDIAYVIDPATWCVSYTGLTPLISETACFVLTDDLGFTDTTYLNIFVDIPETETITDTLDLVETDFFCFDTGELAGEIAGFANICPDLSDESVEFALDDVSLCVEIIPLSVGTDTACIVICDNLGICDTTFFHITVTNDNVPNPTPPVAVDDVTTISLNTNSVVNVLNNDTIPAGSTDVTVTILTAPANGTATVNSDGTISYQPDEDFCGSDAFTYELCNQVGCDEATVSIEVSCNMIGEPAGPIEVYTGFSPNGDGTNDTFVIENIEDYPEHSVRVYNRWGTAVLDVENAYRNDWDGTWEGKTLPDGTYFYVLEIGNERFDGYLQIRR